MEHIRQAFNRFAQEYDTQREHIIPEMRQFYGTAVWAMESTEAEPAILDIGAGTGLMSAYLLDKFPQAHLTLVDIAENMLDLARQRFAGRENMIAALRALQRSTAAGPEMAAAGGGDNAFKTLQINGSSGGLLHLLFSTHPPLESRIAALEAGA